jgi:hypothetical protein
MGQFPGGPSVKLNALPPLNVAAFRVTKLEVRSFSILSVSLSTQPFY